jgi:hypothetical protein
MAYLEKEAADIGGKAETSSLSPAEDGHDRVASPKNTSLHGSTRLPKEEEALHMKIG